MNTRRLREAIRRAVAPLRMVFGRGIFPHQWSRLIDNPLRRAIISPRRLADRITPQTGALILEVGPGSGYFSAELVRATAGGRLVLADIQPEMLQKARDRKRLDRATHMNYTVCDAGRELPFRTDTFDVVVMVSVLGEITDQATCLESAERVLKPGGILAIHESIPDPDLMRYDEVRALAVAAQFRVMGRWGPAFNYTATFRKADTSSHSISRQ